MPSATARRCSQLTLTGILLGCFFQTHRQYIYYIKERPIGKAENNDNNSGHVLKVKEQLYLSIPAQAVKENCDMHPQAFVHEPTDQHVLSMRNFHVVPEKAPAPGGLCDFQIVHKRIARRLRFDACNKRARIETSQGQALPVRISALNSPGRSGAYPCTTAVRTRTRLPFVRRDSRLSCRSRRPPPAGNSATGP